MISLNKLSVFTCACLFFSNAPQTLADGQELSVSVSQCQGDTNTFSIDYVTISCDDYCTWGSEATFSGSYTIGNSLSTESPVITAKVWGMTSFDDTVDICDNGNVYNDNGDYCPDIGTYGFITSTTVPGSPSSWYATFATWLSFTVYTTFDFGDAVVVCEVNVEGQNYASSSSSYIISGSALMFVGIVAALRMKNRRRIISTGEDNGNESATHFVEMTSP